MECLAVTKLPEGPAWSYELNSTEVDRSREDAADCAQEACARACAAVAQWLRTRKASRVSSGRPSQQSEKSYGPESEMQAFTRGSKAAARGA